MTSRLDAIARGARLDPLAIRVVFAGLVLLIAVALAITLFIDPCTAVLGAVVTIIALAAAYVLATRGAHWSGGCGVCVARIGIAVFVVVTVAELAAWGAGEPKPLGCLLRPCVACISDVTMVAAFPDVKPDDASLKLRRYLYPADQSGVRNASRAHDVDDALIRLGHPQLSYAVLLNDPARAQLRANLVNLLGVDEILWREKAYG